MMKLMKKKFDLWCQKRWLKAIDKETNKYRKLKTKLSIQRSVIKALLDRYEELYEEDKQESNTDTGDIILKNVEVKQ